jgi:hypothetical protein
VQNYCRDCMRLRQRGFKRHLTLDDLRAAMRQQRGAPPGHKTLEVALRLNAMASPRLPRRSRRPRLARARNIAAAIATDSDSDSDADGPGSPPSAGLARTAASSEAATGASGGAMAAASLPPLHNEGTQELAAAEALCGLGAHSQQV